MLTEAEIVGYWYDPNPGGQSSENLPFLPSGKGCLDFYNPGPAGRIPFRWRLLDGGTRIRFEPPLWANDTVDVSSSTKDGRRILRLEFDTPDGEELGIPGGRVGTDYWFTHQSLSEFE